MTALIIESPGLERLELDDWQAGWVVKSVEVGSPQVRESVTNRPSGHGTLDRTALVGARAVTADMVLAAGPLALRQLVDRIAPYLDVGRRIKLTLGDGTARRSLTVRSNGETPIAWEHAGYLETTLGWVTVGYPFWRGTQRSIIVSPFAASTSSGVTPPLTPPVYLPPGDPAQSGVVVNAGTVDAHWTAEIVGPAVDIGVENLTTGQKVALNGLTVAAGQTALIDSYARTVTVDGQPRYAQVDAAATSWWTLPPGRSSLTVPTVSWQNPARVWFKWHDSYYA